MERQKIQEGMVAGIATVQSTFLTEYVHASVMQTEKCVGQVAEPLLILYK